MPVQTVIPSPFIFPSVAIPPATLLAATRQPELSTLTPTFEAGFSASGSLVISDDCAQSVAGYIPTPVITFSEDNLTGSTTPIDEILAHAGQYGIDAVYYEYFRAMEKGLYTDSLVFEYLTNDGTTELVFVTDGTLYIIGCLEGAYGVLFEKYPGLIPAEIIHTGDGNRNGLPEMLIQRDCNDGSCAHEVLEWGEDAFQDVSDLISTGWACDGSVHFRDMDGNRVQEIIVDRQFPVYTADYEQSLARCETCTYEWDGNSYAVTQQEFGFPRYRFQAAQDGDLYTIYGQYERALEMYRYVIYSNTLEWWSSERHDYLAAGLEAEGIGQTPAVSATPLPDPEEYDNLAAYAYYRLMVLYLLQGWETDAGLMYESLQIRYAEGEPGHAYVEMAARLWNGYQESRDLRSACTLAVEYARENQDAILYYPSGGTHGSIVYAYRHNPESVCPFDAPEDLALQLCTQ